MPRNFLAHFCLKCIAAWYDVMHVQGIWADSSLLPFGGIAAWQHMSSGLALRHTPEKRLDLKPVHLFMPSQQPHHISCQHCNNDNAMSYLGVHVFNHDRQSKPIQSDPTILSHDKLSNSTPYNLFAKHQLTMSATSSFSSSSGETK